jgi:hypothetical protein
MKRFAALFLVVFLAAAALAKNDPPIVMLWPPEKPALKLTFEKFHVQSSYGKQSVYTSDVTVQNLADQQIPRVLFTVSLLDKNNVRIGEGTLDVSGLDPGQSAKMEFQFYSVGVPVSLTLASAAKTIPVRIISVPSGAKLKVDGRDNGITPVTVRFTVGSHQLDLIKEGYAPGSAPLDVTPDELPGGSVTVELGGLSRDTVELRDGTVLLGDVISMSLTDVLVRVGGKDQSYPRNQVKKLMLVEREIEQHPAVVQPAPAPPHP